jgi:hypothetical protein
VGSITGYSAADVGISEKVWLHYTGTSTYAGKPTTFVLRDILSFAKTLADAKSQVNAAARTNSIFIGETELMLLIPSFNTFRRLVA